MRETYCLTMIAIAILLDFVEHIVDTLGGTGHQKVVYVNDQVETKLLVVVATVPLLDELETQVDEMTMTPFFPVPPGIGMAVKGTC